MTSQIELEKLATEFKTTHSERQALITQWEETIAKLKRRDEELIDEEEKNIKVWNSNFQKKNNQKNKVREELIAREQHIKEKRAFLTTESENNVELEKKIEIKVRGPKLKKNILSKKYK